jgi:hypothetical protein
MQIALPKLVMGLLLVASAGTATAVIASRHDKKQVTLSEGTTLVGALDHSVSTEKADVGDRVELVRHDPVPLEGGSALPAGVVIRGRVTHVKGGGRIAGAPELTLRFSELEVDGDRYDIDADPIRLRGKSDAKESALEIAGGTVAGAVIGAVAGGGSGAAKGAVVGAAVGTGVAVVTKGNQIVLPAGQRIRIRLTRPVTVTYSVEESRGESK